MSGQRDKRRIVEFAIVGQPRPTGVKVALVRPDVVRRIISPSGLLLELMVVPGKIAKGLKIEQRNCVGQPLVQKEVIFADALKRQERAVQQEILFIVEPIQGFVHSLLGIDLNTE